MKRFMSVVLSMVVVLMMCGGAMAEECFNAQGSAVAPGLLFAYRGAGDWTSPYIILNNITDKSVQCRVTVYNQDGTDVTSFGYVLTGGSSWITVSSGTGDMEIPAYSTRIYSINPSGGQKAIMGHATIQWKSDDVKLRNALVGVVMRHRVYGSSRSDAERVINPR